MTLITLCFYSIFLLYPTITTHFIHLFINVIASFLTISYLFKLLVLILLLSHLVSDLYPPSVLLVVIVCSHYQPSRSLVGSQTLSQSGSHPFNSLSDFFLCLFEFFLFYSRYIFFDFLNELLVTRFLSIFCPFSHCKSLLKTIILLFHQRIDPFSFFEKLFILILDFHFEIFHILRYLFHEVHLHLYFLIMFLSLLLLTFLRMYLR